MQGLFIGNRRPQSKKEVKEWLEHSPSRVYAEVTSIFGNEFGGPMSEAPLNKRMTFVGPDPTRKRSFYINITPIEKKGVRTYKVE